MNTSKQASKTSHKAANEAPETIIVASDVNQVSCDGGMTALGHPRVWYSFDGADSVTCGYCGRLFIKQD